MIHNVTCIVTKIEGTEIESIHINCYTFEPN